MKVFVKVMMFIFLILPTTCASSYGVVFQNGPSGGYGGSYFTIKPKNLHPQMKLIEIRVREGTLIDSIQAVYRNVDTGVIHTSGRMGGSGGRVRVIRLGNDEYLTEITGTCDNLVRSISLKTNKHQYPPNGGAYGGGGGSRNFRYYAMKGVEIAGLFGRSGKYLDAIGVFYRNINPNEVLLRSFSMSEHSGGPGGNAFRQHEAINDRIVKVTIWADRFINGLQFSYKQHDSDFIYSQEISGTARGQKNIFILDEDEYITAISGKYGDIIDSLMIKTNKKTSEKFGGDGGGMFFRYEAPKHSKILGITGFANKHINSIGVSVEPVTSLDYCGGDDNYYNCSGKCYPYWFLGPFLGNGHCDAEFNCCELGYDLGDCD